MSRLQLSGHGDPIPNIALPDPKLSADMPVQSLVLVDGTNFEKADWVALGYTHYEVWCVGAAGGLGAEGGDSSHDLVTQEQVVMPDWMWEQQIAQWVNNWAGQGITSFPVYEFSTVPGHTGEVVVRYQTLREHAIELLEINNPDHLTTVFHHHDPQVVSLDAPVVGGAGGGGGLHVVSGPLSELPNSVPIAVGAAGIDALPAQIKSPDPYDPYASWDIPSPYYISNPDAWAFLQFTQKWPDVEDRTLLLPGQPGGDGGASAFGDICMASGGKGGGPAIVWVSGQRMFAAHGGEGGIGGRLAAGGGAAGSTSAANGKDGTWDGEIGQGGGGGRGGMYEIKPQQIEYRALAMGL